jgi:hypothetical protein
MPGGRLLQLAMSLGTAVLGALVLMWTGTSELGMFGWVFLVLGVLGGVCWFVLPINARR